MGERKPNSKEFWEKETDFICQEAKKDYPMGGWRGFDNYRRLQERLCRDDGFSDLADKIKKTRSH